MTRLTLLLIALSTSVASAQAPGQPAADGPLALAAHGGVTFTAPTWKKVREHDAIAVLERAADAKTPFALLLLAIEEGPASAEQVDWTRIRDNIVGAAKETGSELTLELAGDFAGPESFKGQRLRGTVKAKDREVSVEMVALVAADVLVTVSALGPKDGTEAGPLAERVAKSAKRAAP